MSEGNELGNLSASHSSFGNCDSGTGTTLSSSGAIVGLVITVGGGEWGFCMSQPANFYGPPSIDHPNPVGS